MKKTIKYTAIVLLALVLITFLIPVAFKGKIVNLVKAEINKNVEAKVDFTDVSLSLLRHFPKLSIGLEDISVTGLNSFEKDTLLSADRIDASVNLWSVLRGSQIQVHGVYLKTPRIHALVNKEGKANWEIAKPDTTTTVSTGTPSPFQVTLEKYAIENGYIFYKDETGNMQAEISGLDHEGSGDFTMDVFTLATKTRALSASFNYEGIPYLINAETGIDADIVIDNGKSKYEFKQASIDVNNLELLADGFFQIDNDSTYSMDLQFEAGSNEFKNFLSLVPAIYRTDFDKIKTNGTAAFKGWMKGIYSPTQLPAYSVDLDVKDGFFQYPDLPQPVKNINLQMQLSNPDGIMDHTVVHVKKGHLEMGTDAVDFRLLFKNPETSRFIDGVVKGKLNLADVTKFVKLPDGTRLSGLVAADAFAKGSLSAIEKQSGAFHAGGFLTITQLNYSSKEFPQPIKNGNFTVNLQNTGGIADATLVDITKGHVEIGNDPVDFNLKITEPVTKVNFNGAARGRFTLDNLKQFVQLEQGTSVKGVMNADLSFAGSKAAIDQKRYDQIQTAGTVDLNGVNYISKDYPGGVSIQTAQLKFNPQNVSLNNFQGRFQNTNLSASGILDNVIGYTLYDQELQGTLYVSADRVALNEWMGTTDTSATTGTSSGTFPVPANMNITVNAKAGSVQYDNVTYHNVRGALRVKDETVWLQNVQTEALDGLIGFSGSYSTKQSKTHPDITLSYDVKNVDIQKAFFAYNTVQKLMPVGKFLAGKLSSQFSMSGRLDDKMFPEFNSLTGKGSLLLIQGILSKFQPLDKLASNLDVNELKDVIIKDVKSHFEFANGKMLIKPFQLKVKDIDMQIGGMHSFDQTIDYIIGMKLPRKYLGAKGNTLVNNLAAQANSKGVPVTLSETVDLNVKMGGSISSPVIKTDLKQAAGDVSNELKQQAAAFVQQKTEETKQTLKDTATAIRNQVIKDVKAEFMEQLSGKKDSTGKASLDDTKKKTVESVKNTLGGLLKKKKPADSTKRE